MNPFSEKSIAKYLKDLRCPYCGGQENFPIPIAFYPDEFSHTVTIQCPKCKHKWEEVYDLVTIRPVK